jgi:hypothetical protein
MAPSFYRVPRYQQKESNAILSLQPQTGMMIYKGLRGPLFAEQKCRAKTMRRNSPIPTNALEFTGN